MTQQDSAMVFDHVCQIAARSLHARVAMIVDCHREDGNNIRGSVGCSRCHMAGDCAIPGLSANDRDLVYIPELKGQSWFKLHPLYGLVPQAKSLLAVSIVTNKQKHQCYLLVVDPLKSAVRSLDTTSLLSDLTAMSAALMGIELEKRTIIRRPKSPPLLQLVADGFQEAAGRVTSEEVDDLASFLMRTLVSRRVLHVRHDVGYVTLRAWRRQAREVQVAAMQSLKRSRLGYAEKHIAREIAGLAEQLGGRSYDAVVAVPGGSSNDENCFSVRLGREVAAQLGLPFVNCLAPQPGKGRSHPRKSAKLRPYELTCEVKGRVLLVDDVATTGTHLEYATLALRKAGADPTPVAWIGASTVKD